jgi:hypothetical protein
MNTITSRLLELFIGLGYFALGIAVCVGLMKFLGYKILAKAGTIFLIGFPVIGILGGTFEWILTGVSKASESITFSMADKCFGIALALYTLAFFSYLVFGESKGNQAKISLC